MRDLERPSDTVVIERLTRAMLGAVQSEPGATASELYSAGLSYLATMLPLMLEYGADAALLREGLEKLLVRCTDPKASVN
jgi:hypothetical protein